MFKRGRERSLREQLEAALRKEKHGDALALYDSLAADEPDEPRWPQRRGDLLLKLGRGDEAVGAYERAVDLYASQGFVARAAAMAKVILGIMPDRMDVLERVDPEAARRLMNQQRRTWGEVPRGMAERGVPRPPSGLPSPAPARPSLMLEAMKLEPAADAGLDEVRFIDVDEDEGVEIEISELEVIGEEVESPESDAQPRPAALLARLPSMPLFADVPPEALHHLLRDSTLVDLEDGQALVRMGEPSDALYVVVEGEVEVKVAGLPPGAVRLGEGEVVGETALLEDVERRADVVARGPLRALRFPRALLEAMVAERPRVGDVLLELLTRRLISNLVRTSELFAAFDQSTRIELARMFEVRRADPGTTLIAEGKRSDGLYVLLLGRVSVRIADKRLELGPGAMVGERSLLSRTPAGATVRTETEAVLLRLPASRFTELAALYPPVLMHLAELAARRAEG
jgi:CRP-like cAMP-binding protein